MNEDDYTVEESLPPLYDGAAFSDELTPDFLNNKAAEYYRRGAPEFVPPLLFSFAATMADIRSLPEVVKNA